MRYLALIVAASHLAACSSNEAETDPRDGGVSDMGTDALPPPPRCEFDNLLESQFSSGPYGTMRHDIAADFSLELTDGTTFTLSENWNGCDSYLFVPDSLRVSDLDPTSLWESVADLHAITQTSPANAHYFFVSRAFSDDLAEVATAAMTLRIEDVLDGLSTEEADYWRGRLHVVSTRAASLGNDVGSLLQGGMGALGFAIDREQTLRGIGSLADVNRRNASPGWPFDNNLAYVVHEVQRYNYEAALRERLTTEDATVVSLWSGEVLSEFEEITIQLPDATQMAEFDTFEIDVTMRCPDSDQIEFGNCGAWDYLAYLFVYDDAEERVELGRFITSYHREGRLIVDATPMLVHVLEGGERTFRWEFAPPWNVQPTATWLDLRFSSQGKNVKPVEAHFLWTGGSFTDGYNTAHPDIDVPIPADAVRTELWAIITGHGGAESNCAEFCDHHHEFTVEGSVYTREHPTVGNPTGCLEEIDNGVIPNQWGTWWYGRGGWCPGQQVEPYVVDVTNDVTPGSTATVSYRGLFFGADPTGDKGNINMVSYLVFYR